MGTTETNLKQEKPLPQEARIQNLRAEGRTYREIAQIEKVSIAQISRILNRPIKQEGEEAIGQKGEIAAKIFQLLEKGKALPEIVIKLKSEPEVVSNFYNEWLELKKVDVNQPNLGRLDERLESHLLDHNELDELLEQAWNAGERKKDSCRYARQDGSCILCLHSDTEGSVEEVSALYCVFCDYFRREIPNPEDTIIQVPVSVKC